MSVYKLFAVKDTTLYSEYDTMNTGKDAILELSKYPSNIYGTQSASTRFLIKFSDDDINFVYDSYISGRDYKAYLKIYAADISGIPSDLTLEARPIYDDWDMGTGRFLNNPITSNGASWTYSKYDGSTTWTTSSIYSTSSYMSDNIGGGSWYTSSVSTQSFGVYTHKDLEFDVTDIVSNILSGSINNNGFIVKNQDSIEFDSNYSYKLTYFGRDTNTIYPPTLEFRWNDFNHLTSSNIINDENIMLSIGNNKQEYDQNSINRFRLNVRSKYPSRTFSTSSLYTNSYILPTSSFYSVKDLKTDLEIISFDDNYTRISSDNIGNYFDIYMNGLEPERWYKILIKSEVSGSTQIFDDNYIFKVKK